LNQRDDSCGNVTARSYAKSAWSYAKTTAVGASLVAISLGTSPSVVASPASTNAAVSTTTNCSPTEFYCASLKRCEQKAAISDTSITNLINANMKGGNVESIQDAWDGKEAVKVVIVSFTTDENGNQYKRPAQTTSIIAPTADGKGKITLRIDPL
jgi:hypothetical protein